MWLAALDRVRESVYFLLQPLQGLLQGVPVQVQIGGGQPCKGQHLLQGTLNFSQGGVQALISGDVFFHGGISDLHLRKTARFSLGGFL